jgi:hypothetical protein
VKDDNNAAYCSVHRVLNSEHRILAQKGTPDSGDRRSTL